MTTSRLNEVTNSHFDEVTKSCLDDLPPLREIIERHGLVTRKALGQHFLCDLNLTRRIAKLAGDMTGHTVIEIGPGPGGLTRALLATNATRVIAIEKDLRCITALADVVVASDGRLDIRDADALKVDLTSLAPAPRAIIANLPYNIGTELLIGWLKQMPEAYSSMTLMFQAEVADRLVAAPNSKAYGRLSVLAQFCCDVKKVMSVPAAAFSPPPKVDSAIVHLTPRADRPGIALANIEKITAAAFGQRRKMLRSSLKSVGGEALLQKASIDPERRAETLSLKEFEQLALLISQ